MNTIFTYYFLNEFCMDVKILGGSNTPNKYSKHHMIPIKDYFSI